MNDPTVTAIHYRLEFADGVVFSPPEGSLTAEMADFNLLLVGQSITLTPHQHFATREAARAAADPAMRSWAVEMNIRLGFTEAQVKYDRTDLVDRRPTPGLIVLQAESSVSTWVVADATLVRGLNRYPPPPDDQFVLSPDVESLWARYVNYKKGREPLLSMAYFTFTMLTLGGSGRPDAATRLNVEESVLRKLSELSSTRGDLMTARKSSPDWRPLSDTENVWLTTAIPRLILQLGYAATGTAPERVTMASLPSLSPRAS